MHESQIYDKAAGLTEFLAANGSNIRSLGFQCGITELNISPPKELRDTSNITFVVKASDIAKDYTRYDFIESLQNRLKQHGLDFKVNLYDKSAIEAEIISLRRENAEVQASLLPPLENLLNSSFPVDEIKKGQSLNEQFQERLTLSRNTPSAMMQNLSLQQLQQSSNTTSKGFYEK